MEFKYVERDYVTQRRTQYFLQGTDLTTAVNIQIQVLTTSKKE
jgi:hypothetical protein